MFFESIIVYNSNCSDPHITGIFRYGIETTVSFYGDDLLLYVSHHSVPASFSVVKEFGQISGCKLNLNKNELFPHNTAAKNYSLSLF